MDLQAIQQNAIDELDRAAALPDIESVYAKYLGRKDGALTQILRGLAALSPEEKKAMGQAANQLRAVLEEKFQAKQKQLQEASLLSQASSQQVDVTLPGNTLPRGHAHPIAQAIRDITAIFRQLGFDVADGPEVESDSNNFTDLNIPEDHPARDMHDTFYIGAKDTVGKAKLLRTHTSPVQIRLMKELAAKAKAGKTAPAPVRIICPGRVFRHEATDATHAAIFHQIEGLAVDQGVSFADLKGVLTFFAQKLFGQDLQVRFRPSYFPFVEPGAEMDVQCFMCKGAKKLANLPAGSVAGVVCNVCRGAGWMEILGAGMVHPQVLRNVGYDPKKVSGYAFGMGVERIVMARHQVKDIRYFLESDLRFLEQFS